jgi:hypothetical protein
MSKKIARAVRLVIERLEARQMFSLSATSVALTGTPGNDNFVVSYDVLNDEYDFSGGSTPPVSVPATTFQSFSLTGAGGSDTLTIEGGSPTLSNDAGADGTSLSRGIGGDAWRWLAGARNEYVIDCRVNR